MIPPIEEPVTMRGHSCVLPPDLSNLAAAHAFPVTEIEPVTTLPSPKMAHASFKALCGKAPAIKLRLVETAEQAARIAAIRCQLPDAHFPKILARRDCAMIEEWIPGRIAADNACNIALLQQAGNLLARIHSSVIPDYPFARLRTVDDRIQRLKRQVRELFERGELTRKELGVILGLARHHKPEFFDAGIIHRDFAAENLVIGEDGRLCVIDNETMTFDAFSYDLARTWYRWPLKEGTLSHFITGYKQLRSCDNFERHFVFWALSALVDAFLFRVRAQTQKQDVPLRMLRKLINTADA